MIYGSSMTDPNFANFKGSQTYAPQSRPGVNLPYLGAAASAASAITPKAPAPSNNVDPIVNALNQAAGSQENAAQDQAEARRQQAWNSYNALAGQAESAKGEAKGQYDWIIDTLGSNKQDLLSKAALNETQNLDELADTEKKTRGEYDTAKKDTLTTYRDLSVQQEKIMRGMGMGQSSRSMEAQLKLNNLLGKDMSTVSAKEADSMSLIARSVANVKQKANDLRDSIERETKSKSDQAALQYQSAVNAINNQLNLAASEREDRINQASADLSAALAGIKTWKANAQVQVGLTISQLTGNLDNFISWALDDKSGLNTDLNTKQQAVTQLMSQINATPLDQETNPLASPTAVKKSSTTQKNPYLDLANLTGTSSDSLLSAMQSNPTSTPNTLGYTFA